jgi:hypothetical protein
MKKTDKRAAIPSSFLEDMDRIAALDKKQEETTMKRLPLPEEDR